MNELEAFRHAGEVLSKDLSSIWEERTLRLRAAVTTLRVSIKFRDQGIPDKDHRFDFQLPKESMDAFKQVSQTIDTQGQGNIAAQAKQEDTKS